MGITLKQAIPMYRFVILFPAMLFLLSSCGQDPQIHEDETDAPLISAAETGNLTELQQLLESNAPVDITDTCQWTPLMKAALNGHLEAARRLLAAGAAVNLTDKGGYSALMLAASNNHAEMVELLLNEGANINQIENTGGWTALIWAAKQGHAATVKSLLQHQAELEHHDHQGKSAIDWAREGRHQAVIELIHTAG